MPMLTLIEVNKFGSMAGRITCLYTWNPCPPKDLIDKKYEGWIFLTPSLIVMDIWKNSISETKAIFDASPSPKKSINRGKKAILGIGNKVYKSGVINWSIFLFLAVPIPTTKPKTIVISIAVNILYKLTRTFIPRSPMFLKIYAKVSIGDGTIFFITNKWAKYQIINIINILYM